LRGGPPPPMRCVEEMIFQILPMSLTMTRSARTASAIAGYGAAHRLVAGLSRRSQHIERKSDCVFGAILCTRTSISPI
jgi:hypothetical protein